MNVKFILIFFISALYYSCNFELIENKGKRLYKLKLPNETNLVFSNNIVESKTISILEYNNMYMGGGVSIGDINNDELPDIFLPLIKNLIDSI